MIQNADIGQGLSRTSSMDFSKDLNATELILDEEELLLDDDGDVTDNGNSTLSENSSSEF